MKGKLRGRNKYQMHLAFQENKELQLHLPHTLMWNKANLYLMLNKHKAVVVKPTNGKQGQNIFFVKKMNANYLIQFNKNKIKMKNREEVFHYINKIAGKRKFMIQQEIDLAKIDGRRFDFRIIIQRRTINEDWVVNGMIVRKAGYKYKVTNLRRHGEVLSLEEALEEINLKDEEKIYKVEEIKKLAYMAAVMLGRKYPKQRIFGADIGMTKNGYLYIFELNRWPLLKGFKALEDQTQYKRIMKYKNKFKKR
ncbi:YheC/YheD family protein [Alteribacillus sp. HJP-4]|uniref:YheC/YheD family protein n=1 Tax=Alteribacillus sp. HJP-4 TaxID=2775394 RepID=UPI0035CD0DC2